MFSCTSKVNDRTNLSNHIYEKEQELKVNNMESDGQKNRKNSLLSTISIKINGADVNEDEDDDDDVLLPGFRFHPTDEELVGFYLRRKVERRPISIELIKQIDIYKYDPWDLPKASNNVGDKEWYFFCKRGRKYRNSIRPNRVTGSGFWKATGIDRPIYSGGGDCIGLKKSLVYYRGCAGKGTKTDWMMHEFRLPSDHNQKPVVDHKLVKPVTQEAAEVWTLCRILKRNVSYRKYMPEWKDISGGKRLIKPTEDSISISKTCNNSTPFDSTENRENYISFNNTSASAILSPAMNIQRSRNDMIMKPINAGQVIINDYNNNINGSSSVLQDYNSIQSSTDPSDFFLNQTDWDELRSMVDMHYNVMGMDVNLINQF